MSFIFSGIADKTILWPQLLVPFTPCSEGGNCCSLPNPSIPLSDPVIQVQRSFSLTLPNTPSTAVPISVSQFGSYHGNWTQRQTSHQYPCSYSRLRHSNSAPVIGGQYQRRRLSLQSLQSYSNEEAWSGPPNGKLRRTSSEVYVDRGEY